MIIVRLKGGMGNQMFQYACGRAIALKHNTPLALDVSFYQNPGLPVRTYDLDLFTIDERFVKKQDIPLLYRIGTNRFLQRVATFLSKKIFLNKGSETRFSFDPHILELGPNAYLDGYWQSPKYFAGYEDVIRKDFTLKQKLPGHVQSLHQEISGCNSVCLHVRRTDYVGNSLHEVVGNDYYSQCIEMIAGKVLIDKVYVFSDDIAWCREHMSFPYPTVFVSQDLAGPKNEWHFALMSAARHFVITNSSYSWWAAWLSSNPDKIVIAPKQWFSDLSIDTSDLIPSEWIRL